MVGSRLRSRGLQCRPMGEAMATLVGPVFDRIADTMIDAFAHRAERALGRTRVGDAEAAPTPGKPS